MRFIIGLLFAAAVAWVMFVPGPVFGENIEIKNCRQYEQQGYRFEENRWDSNVTTFPNGDMTGLSTDDGKNRNLFFVERSNSSGTCTVKCRK